MVNFTECIEDIRTNHGFKHNSHDDSFYRTYQVEGGKFLQLRVSNHGTYLCTWIEKDYDPSLALSNISIVFTEDGKCESNTAVDMGDKKRSYKVIQYIYNCAVLDNNDILRINNRMYDIITNRGYIDPLSDNKTKKAKVYTLEPNQKPQLLTQPIQENNKQIHTNKNMKINESQLRNIIKESINDMLLNEYGEQQNTINEPNSQLLSMFVQESEQLRRSLAQFQDTARQIRQESMQLQNTVGFIQKFGNNLNAFGQQFMNYCNNFLNKLQPQQQRQQQQPMQQNNTNSQS